MRRVYARGGREAIETTPEAVAARDMERSREVLSSASRNALRRARFGFDANLFLTTIPVAGVFMQSRAAWVLDCSVTEL
jgi:hypothetical protein